MSDQIARISEWLSQNNVFINHEAIEIVYMATAYPSDRRPLRIIAKRAIGVDEIGITSQLIC